jgi:hypothetical protein
VGSGVGVSVNTPVGTGVSVNSSVGAGVSVNSSVGAGVSVTTSLGAGVSVTTSIGTDVSIGSSDGMMGGLSVLIIGSVSAAVSAKTPPSEEVVLNKSINIIITAINFCFFFFIIFGPFSIFFVIFPSAFFLVGLIHS